MLLGGIEAILDAEGLERVDGGSFGGLVAQCFVRHTPRRVRRLLLQGNEDKISKGEHHGELEALYPNARVHTFEGVGHGVSLLRSEEWGRVIGTFLSQTG